ncbi:unnamed protein product (macronuclear) [Paramecium tetraurelia]|uniref:Protein kinase domain-containing protein n=1 Tax=Paramecium tetraurelia TaxID=5888 RepID=A0E136_PARTE|nr:uncharacterized protein GSPATT00022172001 [Paramecium tetraurelia]CAK89003.1 unnamed protein product [Paramecium tetraurelia]|eukprot:XP_001456400.1 hypothetical protein (macronuclear) [Paramecium tetraurelia strain d4-2]
MMDLMNLQSGVVIDAPTQQFKNRSFQLKHQLGKGAEGQVFLAKPQNWNKDFEVALKFSKPLKETEREFIQNLIEAQNENDKQGSKNKLCSNIIRIYEIFEIQYYSVQVMEVGSVNLFKYTSFNHNRMTNVEKFKICLQLINAINFIHMLGLIHRDVKGENFILVNEEFKLIDFGLISINERLMTSKPGTRIFQAPELFEDQGQYTQSLDIWSLGCVFYEIIKGEELFPCINMNLSIQQIKNHKTNQNHVYQLIDRLKVCQEWRDLLKQMLHPNQFNRIKIAQAIKIVQLCIVKEENSGGSIELKASKQQLNLDSDISKIEFELQLNQKQNEFNKILREKEQIIQQLEHNLKKKENEVKQHLEDIEQLTIKVNKFEFEKNKLEQEKKKNEESFQQQYQQYAQQCQNHLNYQASQISNQQASQFNQQKQIYENEIKNLKIRIQVLEQENSTILKKHNQIKEEENAKSKVVDISKEILFLDKLIGDLDNEISNLEKSLESFKSIQQLLQNNNTLVNSQIQDIEQLITQKKKSVYNYQKIKLEIQNQDSNQLKQQSEFAKNTVEFNQQQDKVLPQQLQGALQITQNIQSLIQNPNLFKPYVNSQIMPPPFVMQTNTMNFNQKATNNKNQIL